MNAPTLSLMPCRWCKAQVFWAVVDDEPRPIDSSPSPKGRDSYDYVLAAWDINAPGLGASVIMCEPDYPDDDDEPHYRLHSMTCTK